MRDRRSSSFHRRLRPPAGVEGVLTHNPSHTRRSGTRRLKTSRPYCQEWLAAARERSAGSWKDAFGVAPSKSRPCADGHRQDEAMIAACARTAPSLGSHARQCPRHLMAASKSAGRNGDADSRIRIAHVPTCTSFRGRREWRRIVFTSG